MTGKRSETPHFSEPPQAAEYRHALLDMRDAMTQWAGFEASILQRRIDALICLARQDIGLARLAEAHLDALSILQEAADTPMPGALYGVWASGGPADTTSMQGTDTATLSGTKPFCSGADLVDCALIRVGATHQLVHVDIAAHADQVQWSDEGWRVQALAGVQTWTGLFDGVPVKSVMAEGSADWYVERPGFWLGALCPAACWAGGAQGLLDYALTVARDSPIAQVHLGRMVSAAFGMRSALRGAAAPLAEADVYVHDAHVRALATRHLVERACTRIVDEFGRMLGPRPLVNMPAIARRVQELQIYLRQCHGDRDLAELAIAVMANDRPAATA